MGGRRSWILYHHPAQNPMGDINNTYQQQGARNGHGMKCRANIQLILSSLKGEGRKEKKVCCHFREVSRFTGLYWTCRTEVLKLEHCNTPAWKPWSLKGQWEGEGSNTMEKIVQLLGLKDLFPYLSHGVLASWRVRRATHLSARLPMPPHNWGGKKPLSVWLQKQKVAVRRYGEPCRGGLLARWTPQETNAVWGKYEKTSFIPSSNAIFPITLLPSLSTQWFSNSLGVI